MSEAEFKEWLAQHLPQLSPQPKRQSRYALGLAYYHAQSLWPVVELLVGDDAPQWEWLAAEVSACWIHVGRHYKKLCPTTAYFRQGLAVFQTKFWDYYRQLLGYKGCPNPKATERLRAEFEQLCVGKVKTGYTELDKRIAQTYAQREQLLTVLVHPELPLHNNASELGARQGVRKRDVSFGPRTERGKTAWDSLQTLAETSPKDTVSFVKYQFQGIRHFNT